jgi:tetratricopeptide (TPR) repeat protein
LHAVLEPTTKNVGQASKIETVTFLDWAIRLSGVSGTLVLALHLLGLARKQLENPIKVDLQRHLKFPSYEGSVSFVEGFHRDFHRILKAYTDDRRVYVFVDDLDRCEVPRAADLMQGINLIIANDPKLVFVIGMDWETVAAGIAVKNEALSRYLTPDRAPLSARPAATAPTIDKNGVLSHPDSRDAMELGREYLDKFVQLRFKLPRPRDEDLRRLLLALSRPAAASTDHSVSQKRRWQWPAKLLPRLRAPVPESNKESNKKSVQQAGEVTAQGTELQQLIEFATNADSDTVRMVALMLMPAFDNNPRRLKQFLGLYRLRIYIAKVTGMFAIPKGKSADNALSLAQLGKFTALELGWPDLLKEAQRDRELLGRLEQAVLGQEAAEVYWLQRRGLAEVIRAGLDGDAAARQQWSLAGFDLSSLLRVSASVGAFDAKIGGPPGAPEGATRPQEELTAQELFERGFATADKNEKLGFYSEAIKLKPDYVLAFLNRGNVRSELGDADGALTDYNEAIRLKPHDAFALYNRAMAYSDRGDVDRARMDYDEAIRLKSDDSDAFINRGIARAGSDDVVGALMDFDQAIRLRRDDAEGYYNRGIARRRDGNLEGALMDYNQAILLKPDDPDAFFNRAITRRASGDREGAAMDFAEASRLGPGPQK